MRKHYTRMLAVLQKEGHRSPRYLDLQKKISAGLMQIRFSARMVEKLCDSVRTEVDNIRQIERKIQDLVVNKGGMPRPDFIKKFPELEVSLRWIDRAGRQFRRKAATPAPVDTRRLAGYRDIDRGSIHEVNRAEVDRILDKIGAQGIDSLTPQERLFLSNFVPMDDRKPPLS